MTSERSSVGAMAFCHLASKRIDMFKLQEWARERSMPAVADTVGAVIAAIESELDKALNLK